MTAFEKYVVSLVIAAVLALQLTATFDLFPRILSRPSHLFWPFLDYPMYRAARYEGSVIERYRVFAATDDGTEVELMPSDFSLNFRKFRDIAVAAIRAGDTQRVTAFAELYRARTGRQLVGVRVERHGDVLTRQGLQLFTPVTVADLRLRSQ